MAIDRVTSRESGRLRRKPTIYQRLFLHAVGRMKRGSLRVELPDHEVLTLGLGEPGGIRSSMTVTDWNFFRRCVLFGDVGFGEAFQEGEWTAEDPSQVIAFFIANVEDTPGLSGSRVRWSTTNVLGWWNRLSHLSRPNHLSGSKKNIREHYDFSNEFFQFWLDPTMTYSCAWFDSAEVTLEQAQLAKIDRLLDRLKLGKDDHLLEIGTGWGSLGIRAVERFGCRVTTLTLSEEQRAEALRRIAARGYSDRIDVRLEDYRKTTGTFDRIVSVEMIEAVGHEFFEDYFAQCNRLLKPHGLLAIQGILCPDSRYDQFRSRVDWIQRHIFPGSLLPSFARIQEALRATGELGLHSFEEMGLHYAETLSRWNQSLLKNAQAIRDLGYEERELRRWSYYFNYCAAAFAMRNITVAQMVFTRPNNHELCSPVSSLPWTSLFGGKEEA